MLEWRNIVTAPENIPVWIRDRDLHVSVLVRQEGRWYFPDMSRSRYVPRYWAATEV